MIKNKLLEVRLSKGYKFQKAFAEHLGIGLWQYNRYENNIVQPSIDTYYKIAQKLGCKIDDLIYWLDD